MKNECSFKVGQKVNAVSFTDCFGKYVPEVRDLTIDEIRFVADHWRITARKGLAMVDGAPRYFEPCN